MIQVGSATPQQRRSLAACGETSGRGTKVRITEVSRWTVGIGRAGASVYRSIRAAHPACGTGTVSRAHTATATAAGTRVRNPGTGLCTGPISQHHTARWTDTLIVHAMARTTVSVPITGTPVGITGGDTLAVLTNLASSTRMSTRAAVAGGP